MVNRLDSVHAYVLNINGEFLNLLCNRYQLSQSSLDRLSDKKNKLASRQFIASRLLIQYACAQSYELDRSYLDIVEGVKPVLKKFSSINISISHSGDFVAVFLTKGLAAIDIETPKSKSRNLQGIFESTFHKDEILYVLDGSDLLERDSRFYEIWTLRECCLKLGLLSSLFDNKFNSKMTLNNSDWFFHYFTSDEYYLTCVMKEPAQISLTKL